MTDEELMSLFEAAKWAPSSYNNQPWRFLYARRDTPLWPLFFDLLQEGNKVWVKNASALIIVLSNTCFDYNGKPSITHSFDAGAAWGSFALQAWLNGYITHGMQGFDYEKARDTLGILADFSVEAMIAIGKQGPKEALSDKMQQPSPSNGAADGTSLGRRTTVCVVRACTRGGWPGPTAARWPHHRGHRRRPYSATALSSLAT